MNATTIAAVTNHTPLVEAAGELLQRGIRERTGIAAAAGAGSAADVILDIESGIGTEGFRIEGQPGEAVRITGADERGLIYGVGKFLRDLRRRFGYRVNY